MRELFTALALAIVLEGLLYAAFPDQMKRMLAQMLEIPTAQLRWVALGVAVAGVALLAVIRL